MTTPFLKEPTAIDALFELIREANPNLPLTVNKDTVTVSAPSTITPIGNLNTQVTLTPKPGVDTVKGTVLIKYRRLNLNNLVFSNGATTTGIRKVFGTTAGTLLTESSNTYAIQTRKKVAERFGIFWDSTNDFIVANPLGVYSASDAANTITANASNLLYVGSFSVVFSANNVNTIQNTLSNRVLQNDLGLADNPDVFYKLLAIYPTDDLRNAYISLFGNDDTKPSTTIIAAHQPFFDVVNTLTGLNLRADVNRSVSGQTGIAGQTFMKVAVTSSFVAPRKGGVVAETDILTSFRSLLGQRVSRVMVVGTTLSGGQWQTTPFIIPLVAVSF